MGISNFHAWLRAKYPQVYTKLQNNNVYEYIYIDVNFMLHNSIYGVKTESEFLKKLCMQFDILFSNVIATKQVYFAMDGPCSFAKILLQRKRRFDAASKTDDAIDITTINSLCLTPGTGFMRRVEGYLTKYIENLKHRYRYTCPQICLSSSDEPGEGEIKICKKVINNGTGNLSHRHLIVGNDSDLIVLSMGMKPIYNINIMVKSKNENELVSLKELLLKHARHIEQKCDIDYLANSAFRDDFVIVSIMMGNDYLPKIGYITFDRIWNIYFDFAIQNGEDTLIKDGKYNIPITSKFMLQLYKNIASNFQKVTIDTYDKDRSTAYLTGLLWCLQMYQTGVCPDYGYIYDHTNSPHPYELLFHFCACPESLVLSHTNVVPIPAHIYPLVILPRKASYLLDSKLQKLVDTDLKYLYAIEDCQVCHRHKKIVGDIAKEYRQVEKDDKKTVELKEKAATAHKAYIEHRDSHNLTFTVKDIAKIVECANKVIMD